MKHNLKSSLKIKHFSLFALSFTLFGSCFGVHPVIFIPGDGGSQVEAKLNKSSVVHYICEKTSKDFFNIWLNIEMLVPYVIDCWVDNIRLVYNNETRLSSNSPGVETRFPGWGISETVEWLDPSHASAGAYFKFIGDVLTHAGYTRNKSIKGAPYDFRKAPNENKDFFTKLKTLVEETYQENNNESVILISHSMGGPMSLYFLNLQTQSWKDKYIKSLITLAGVWGGSMKAVKAYAMGDDLGSYILKDSVMRQVQISCPSLAWLMPSQFYWKKDEVLVETEKKNYSLTNIKDFFWDINYASGWDIFKDVRPYTLNFTAPGVEVHCIYGVSVPTVERLYYKAGTWLDGKPTLIYGDGDGTVNRRSLEGCLHWQELQKKKIFNVVIPKVDHMQILNDKNVLSYVENLIKHVSMNKY